MAFDLFDKDGDGTISTQELGIVIRSLGKAVTDQELQQMIDSVDEDQNGIIDFHEFLALMSSSMKEPEKKDEYAEAFKVFDRDNSS